MIFFFCTLYPQCDLPTSVCTRSGMEFSSWQLLRCCVLDLWPKQCCYIDSFYCRAVSVQHQGCHCFSAAQPVNRSGVHKRWGGHTSRYNPNGPKQYFMPYNNMFSNAVERSLGRPVVFCLRNRLGITLSGGGGKWCPLCLLSFVFFLFPLLCL